VGDPPDVRKYKGASDKYYQDQYLRQNGGPPYGRDPLSWRSGLPVA